MSAEIKRAATELESLLLSRVLRDMRETGRWDDQDGGGLGAASFFEALDTELARHLSGAGGLGLAAAFAKGLSTIEGSDAVKSPVVTSDAPGEHEPLRFAVPQDSITSGYGWRRDPFSGVQKFHRGIDVRAAYGDEIQAAGAGRVVFSGEQGGYGNTIVIEHAGGVQTRYAHLSANTVRTGDAVAAGQAIGRAGQSGRATGTHLHFEVTVNGQPVSPAAHGLDSPTPGEN